MLRAAALLLIVSVVPAHAQWMSEPEAIAAWTEASRPLLRNVEALETIRECRVVDSLSGRHASDVLGGMASLLFAQQFGAYMHQERWLADFHAAERRGRAAATPDLCGAIRNDPAKSGPMKAWVRSIEAAG